MTTLLEVKNLVTRFYTPQGVVHAVNGISYRLNKGESMALVGESGCGKSVSALSLLGLVPSPPGVVEQGEVLFEGVDLLRQTERQLRHVRGGEIGMVFQDPMTSLNPVLTIGKQLVEGIRLHRGLDASAAQKRTIELLNLVGIPDAEIGRHQVERVMRPVQPRGVAHHGSQRDAAVTSHHEGPRHRCALLIDGQAVGRHDPQRAPAAHHPRPRQIGQDRRMDLSRHP